MSPVLLLATEAASSGGTSPRTIAVIVLVVALVGFAIAYFIVGPGRRKKGPRQSADIPLAMRPYHSDDELETTGIERAMAWGFALTLFMALFLPVYWALEPVRIEDKQDEVYNTDVEAGRALFGEACASCHGPSGEGGTAPNPYSDAPWPAPQLNNIVTRYEDNTNVSDIGAFITTTVRRGRPGTPMPAWSAAFNGPMNDQEIDRIVDYILAIQTGEEPQAQAVQGKSGDTLFADNCARCHGPNAEGREEFGLGPSLDDVYQRYGWDGSEEGAESVDETIFQTVHQGRLVPTGADMPSFADVLSDSAIERIVEYLKSIQKRG